MSWLLGNNAGRAECCSRPRQTTSRRPPTWPRSSVWEQPGGGSMCASAQLRTVPGFRSGLSPSCRMLGATVCPARNSQLQPHCESQSKSFSAPDAPKMCIKRVSLLGRLWCDGTHLILSSRKHAGWKGRAVLVEPRCTGHQGRRPCPRGGHASPSAQSGGPESYDCDTRFNFPNSVQNSLTYKQHTEGCESEKHK